MVRKVHGTKGTKSPRKVRKVHGTNRPWYEKSTNGTKRLWYEKSVERKVWHSVNVAWYGTVDWQGAYKM